MISHPLRMMARQAKTGIIGGCHPVRRNPIRMAGRARLGTPSSQDSLFPRRGSAKGCGAIRVECSPHRRLRRALSRMGEGFQRNVRPAIPGSATQPRNDA
jgi:hypothetical protein